MRNDRPTPPTACIAAAALVLLAAVRDASASDRATTPLTTVRIAQGLSFPVWAGSPPGDDRRLFVVEQSGRIRVLRDGVLLAAPFLDVSAKIATGGERGLLGMAFHPDFAANGYVFVNYTAAEPDAGNSVVERYHVSSANPDLADPDSATLFLGPVAQPYASHNGGHLAFGPDGFLYVGLGDGGGTTGDPGCRAQDPALLLGKMLRLDVDANPDGPAVAPPDNPFRGLPGVDERIWAIGLRNPWRYSFDRATGDLWIADVGEHQAEEIDLEPAGSGGGRNYGWKIMEGNACFGAAGCPAGTPACNDASFTRPLLSLAHGGTGNSITGGFVYRGCAIPDLRGSYLFADYVTGAITSLRLAPGAPEPTVAQVIDRTLELQPPDEGDIAHVSSFAEDARGELYLLDHLDGEIFAIVPALPAAAIDLGYGKPGGNGLVPSFRGCGLLGAGDTATFTLSGAPSNAIALLLVAHEQHPAITMGMALVPDLAGPHVALLLFTDAQGRIEFSSPGGGGPLDVFAQFVVADPQVTFGAAASNALEVHLLP